MIISYAKTHCLSIKKDNKKAYYIWYNILIYNIISCMYFLGGNVVIKVAGADGVSLYIY